MPYSLFTIHSYDLPKTSSEDSLRRFVISKPVIDKGHTPSNTERAVVHKWHTSSDIIGLKVKRWSTGFNYDNIAAFKMVSIWGGWY